ncbi:MAG: glutamyl-tRNA reductase [Jiangellaceae bacterium]
MSVLVMGMSHRTTPVEVLETVTLDRDAMGKILDEVPASDHIGEAVLVSTCNRLELYADVATFHGGLDEAGSILSAHTGVPLELLTPYLYVHYEDRAVAHLFHVASGLDSMVVGESQILGQIRDAFRLAQTSGATGRVLTELFQTGLRVGKRAHAETGIDRAGRSLVTLGLAGVMPAVAAAGSSAGRVEASSWQDLANGRRALIVGAGSMASLAASTLAREGADVVVANRTHHRAERLAASIGGEAVAMADIAAVLDDVDLLVTCTGAPGLVVPYEMIEGSVDRRGSRVLGILDLALPRDVDTAVTELPGVVLTDLATLAAARDADGGLIADDVAAVRAIVADEVVGYVGARRAAQAAPTVVALRSMADDVVAAELSRLAGRLPDLDERVRTEVSVTVRRVVDKLLHAPTVRVKELSAQPDGAGYEAALRELFALDRRAVDAVVKPDPGGPA